MTDPTEDGDTADEPPPVGPSAIPLADEARALLTLVQDWAQRTLPERSHGGPECQWCPLCQFANILRGEHPDVADRLAEAGTALAGALRSFLDSTTQNGQARVGTAPGTSGDATRAGKPRPGPTSRVQHIRLDHDTDADRLDPSP